MLKLTEIEQRAERATKGPWEEREDGDYYQGGTYIGAEPFHYGYRGPGETDWGEVPGREARSPLSCYFKHDVARIEGGDDDKAFLIAARADVPLLCRALRIAVATLDRIAYTAKGAPAAARKASAEIAALGLDVDPLTEARG